MQKKERISKTLPKIKHREEPFANVVCDVLADGEWVFTDDQAWS